MIIVESDTKSGMRLTNHESEQYVMHHAHLEINRIVKEFIDRNNLLMFRLFNVTSLRCGSNPLVFNFENVSCNIAAIYPKV